jgi:hypothetical protein
MNGLDTVQQIIDRAETSIQEELDSGAGNPWLACFVSVLAMLRSTFEINSDGRTPEPYDTRIRMILSRKEEVQQQYGWDPPREIKQDLLNQLKDLLG